MGDTPRRENLKEIEMNQKKMEEKTTRTESYKLTAQSNYDGQVGKSLSARMVRKKHVQFLMLQVQ